MLTLVGRSGRYGPKVQFVESIIVPRLGGRNEWPLRGGGVNRSEQRLGQLEKAEAKAGLAVDRPNGKRRCGQGFLEDLLLIPAAWPSVAGPADAPFSDPKALSPDSGGQQIEQITPLFLV